MWIRSQNKKYLINCKNLGIRKMQNKYVVALISECSDFYTLGSYSSEEKALKVLDEIQTCIMTEHRYHTDDENCTMRFFTKEWKEIYQMPADEDI